MNIENQIMSELDVNKSMEHVLWLTDNTPERISGKGDDTKAALYIYEKMKEYGLYSYVEKYDSYNSLPIYSKLTVLEPENRIIESLPCCHISSTSSGGIDIELEYVGAGAHEDYAGKDVKGKAVLVEVSYSPASPEKARIALEKGAVAMIFMNWGNDEDVICNRAMKTVWGVPTPETFNQIPQIIALSIARKSGLYLKEMCLKNNNVKINIISQATRQWDKLSQPVAILKGSENPEEFLLVGAHLDAWKPGVTDNATGNANVLEIARVLSKHKDRIKRSIMFVFYNGHEIAESSGSTYLVDSRFSDLDKNCIGNVWIDSPGMKDATLYLIKTSRELKNCATDIIRKQFKDEIKIEPLAKVGDQSFFGVGIPTVAGRMSFTEEYIKKNNGATLGYWNHTSEENLDKVNIENLEKDLYIECALILELANSDILPYEFLTVCEDISEKLKMITERSGNIVDLTDINNGVALLTKRVEQLDSMKDTDNRDKINLINKAQIKLSRLLTYSFYTYTDRYSQNTYGLGIMSKPIPLLYECIELKEMQKDTQKYKLLFTKMMKNRNMVYDAVNNAVELMDMYLFRLKSM